MTRFWLIILAYIIIGALLAIEVEWSMIKLLKVKGKGIIEEVKEDMPILLRIIFIWPFIMIIPFVRDKMHRNRISNF